MKTRNKAVPASYLFLEKNGKILIGRRCNTGYRDGEYQVPAGHIEEGELPTEALIREVKEEIGIDINHDDIELVHVSYSPIHDETGDRVDFFFKVTKWNGEVTNMEPNKCDDLIWVSPNELPENFTFHVRKAVKAMMEGISFEEITLDMLKENGMYIKD